MAFEIHSFQQGLSTNINNDSVEVEQGTGGRNVALLCPGANNIASQESSFPGSLFSASIVFFLNDKGGRELRDPGNQVVSQVHC